LRPGLNLDIAINYLGSKSDYIGLDKDLDMLKALKILYDNFEVFDEEN